MADAGDSADDAKDDIGDDSGPEYWFYHLEASTVQSVLPDLLEKTLARGWRALVKCAGEGLSELDGYLWTYRDLSFLPHGRDDEPLADQHPIVLSATTDAAEGADCVIMLDGTDVTDLSGTSRAIVMINGRNSEDVARERARWKRLKDAGATLSYFQQNPQGRWEKMA